MNLLVPNRFLFSLEFPLRFRSTPPVMDGRLDDWSAAELLPKLGELDGRPDFADVWACWNESGLFIACRVTDKKKPLRCEPRTFWTSDHFRLCTDMRDARTNKRATRYCRQFYFLPTGGGPAKDRPVAGATPFRQAQENAPPPPSGRLAIAARLNPDGYTLEAHVPADCLTGFDPIEHPRIGFYYILEDSEHGQQFLTVGDDLSWYIDPSTWATAVLAR